MNHGPHNATGARRFASPGVGHAQTQAVHEKGAPQA
jgi:hypothetical protein